jgi:uncharacterized protein
MRPGHPTLKAGAPMGVRAFLLLLLLLLAAPALAAAPSFPRLTGRVVDDAHVLSPSARSELTAMLARHEQATGEQVVVVTLPSLQGHSIEDFGYQLGRYWGIGQKDKNTGALLVVAPKEHKVRIEVGYGLEGKLTDAQSRVIIDRDILPEFRRGDFNAGVLAGTTTILKVLGGDAAAAQAPVESGGSVERFADTFLTVPGFFALCVILMLLFVALRNRLTGRHHIIRRVGRSGGDDFTNDSFFSGGSSDSGVFSGGGGSFGGGGASGSW